MNKADKEYFQKLGKRLQYLRQKHGYTLSELAKYLEVAKQTVGAYEQGISRIQMPRLYKLSLLYKINLIEFFMDVEDNIPEFHRPKYETGCNIKMEETEDALLYFHNKLQRQIAEVEKIKFELEQRYGRNLEKIINEEEERKEA
jgi:transcriptional regulator with XRE-family HTH domain